MCRTFHIFVTASKSAPNQYRNVYNVITSINEPSEIPTTIIKTIEHKSICYEIKLSYPLIGTNGVWLLLEYPIYGFVRHIPSSSNLTLIYHMMNHSLSLSIILQSKGKQSDLVIFSIPNNMDGRCNETN